jgi:hypothetical protein
MALAPSHDSGAASPITGQAGNLNARPKRDATTRHESPLLPRALRPAQIAKLYGIPVSTVHYYCTALPESERLPSCQLPCRKSPTATTARKGSRLVLVADLEAWLARWRSPRLNPPH